MIIRNELGQQPPEMALVQGDDVVEQLAPAAAHPALRNPVLPRASEGSLDRSDAHGLKGFRNFQPVLRVTIQDEEPGCRLVRKRLSQLLHDPATGGMMGDVEMEKASPIMTDDEEAVQETEGERGYRKQVHGGRILRDDGEESGAIAERVLDLGVRVSSSAKWYVPRHRTQA